MVHTICFFIAVLVFAGVTFAAKPLANKPPAKGCKGGNCLDIALLVETSIEVKSFDLVKLQMKNLLEYFDISNQGTHVAIVTFSDVKDHAPLTFKEFSPGSTNGNPKRVNDVIDSIALEKTLLKGSVIDPIGMAHVVFSRKFGVRKSSKIMRTIVIWICGGSIDPKVESQRLKILVQRRVEIFAIDTCNSRFPQKFIGNLSRVFPMPEYYRMADKVTQSQQCKDCRPLDLALVLDHSGSIDGEEWKKLVSTASLLITALPFSVKQAHLAVVTFDSTASVRIYFNVRRKRNDYFLKELTELRKNRPTKDGRTNRKARIDKALKLVREDVFQTRSGMRGAKAIKVCVVLTDGNQTPASKNGEDYIKRLASESKKLRESGVNVFAWGVGPIEEQDLCQLEVIASEPFTTYVSQEPSIKTVKETFNTLAKCKCTTSQDSQDDSGETSGVPSEYGDQAEADETDENQPIEV